MLSPFLCIFFAVAIAFAWTTHSPEERNLSLLIANACRGSLQPEFLELVREFSMVCEKLLRSVRVVILQSFLHRGKCHKIASPLWIDSISFTTPRRDPRESLIHSCMYSPLAVKGVFLGSIASFYSIFPFSCFSDRWGMVRGKIPDTIGIRLCYATRLRDFRQNEILGLI